MYAMQKTPSIGIRRDNLGNVDLDTITGLNDWTTYIDSNTTYNLSDTTVPAGSGSNSLSFSMTGGYKGLSFHRYTGTDKNEKFDLSPYTTIHFEAYVPSSQTGSKLSLVFQ